MQALLAVRSLLQLTSTDASDLRDYCSLDQVLESLREGLDKSNVEEDRKDYSDEIESLRKEVLILFRNKLGNVSSVFSD